MVQFWIAKIGHFFEREKLRQHFFCFSSAFYCLSILQGRHYNIISLYVLVKKIGNKIIFYEIFLV